VVQPQLRQPAGGHPPVSGQAGPAGRYSGIGSLQFPALSVLNSSVARRHVRAGRCKQFLLKVWIRA
jgi:hypothetical protein